MHARINLKLDEYDWENDQLQQDKARKGIRGYVGKFTDKLSKYVTFDKDGIFKDPNWPHLWT